MTKIRHLLVTGLLATVLAAPASVHAATQGTVGATSTGTVGVSLSIAQQYRISGLSDFSLGTYSGTGNMTANQDICVYTNDAMRQYKVRVTDSSSMSGSGFSVQNASNTAHIAYSLRWNNGTGPGGNTINYNSPLTAYNANVTSTDCSSGGKSANMEITVAQSDLASKPSGSYSTTLTIVIEP